MKDRIAKRLGELRNRENLTLEKLAQKAGCTKSYISQLEKGTTTPSVSMLGRLAHALNTSVVALFRDNNVEELGNWHLRKTDRRIIHYPDGKVITQLLTKGIFQKKMQPVLSVIEPGGMLSDSPSVVHPKGSEEFVLVLQGEVEFEIGLQRMSLQEGDTVYFHGDLPHCWVNKGKESAEVLFVWTPPVW